MFVEKKGEEGDNIASVCAESMLPINNIEDYPHSRWDARAVVGTRRRGALAARARLRTLAIVVGRARMVTTGLGISATMAARESSLPLTLSLASYDGSPFRY